MTDIAIIGLAFSTACTYSLIRRHRDLALVSGLVTVCLVVVVIGGWQ